MSDLLKGNYKSPKLKSGSKVSKPADGLSNDFEKKAMERLGGSIAFVMKSKTFLWTEGEGSEKK